MALRDLVGNWYRFGILLLSLLLWLGRDDFWASSGVVSVHLGGLGILLAPFSFCHYLVGISLASSFFLGCSPARMSVDSYFMLRFQLCGTISACMRSLDLYELKVRLSCFHSVCDVIEAVVSWPVS